MFVFKQKTAYEMRISDWSSDVCSSDLRLGHAVRFLALLDRAATVFRGIDQFGGKLARHAVLAAIARRVDQPAHRQRHAARMATFDRHPVGGAAAAAGLAPPTRRDFAQRLLNASDRVRVHLVVTETTARYLFSLALAFQ